MNRAERVTYMELVEVGSYDMVTIEPWTSLTWNRRYRGTYISTRVSFDVTYLHRGVIRY